MLDAVHTAGIAPRSFPRHPGPRSSDAADTFVELFGALREECVLVLERPDTFSGPVSEVAECLSRLARVSPRPTILVTVAPASPWSEVLGGIVDTQVSAEDLLFTEAEVVDLCRSAGLAQPKIMGRRIHAVCDGIPRWVSKTVDMAGRYSGPVVDAHGRPAAELIGMVAADLDSMLGTLGADLERELARTLAPARTLSEPLAQELLPTAQSVSEILTDTYRAGLLVPAESSDQHRYWRFPVLVRQALLDLARKADPEHLESVLTLLARRALSNNDPASAARYAADAGDWPLALDICEQHWVTMVIGNIDQLREILDSVPEQYLQDRPSVKAGKSVFVGLLAQAPILGPSLPASDTELLDLADSPTVTSSIHVATVQSIGLRVAGRYRDAVNLTRRIVTLATAALDQQPELVHAQLPVLRLQWALTFQLAGADFDAISEFMSAYRGAVAEGIDFAARNSAGNLALLWAMTGHAPRAHAWLAREVDFGDGGEALAPMVRMGGSLATALTSLDRLDLATATTALDTLGEPSHREELWAYIAYVQAQCALLHDGAYAGLMQLQRLAAERRVQCSPSSFATVLITAARVDLHLALGQGNLAATTVADAVLNHPLLVLASARVALYTGCPDETLEIVTRSLSSEAGSPREHIEGLLIRAAAHHKLGDVEVAADCWRTACALAEQSDCYRPFTTVSLRLRRALADATGIAPTLDIDRSVFPETVHHVQLTAREHSVLSCMARGLSQQQIADEQFVSANTVKSQMRSLYRKLGAHSKAEALATARKLRLLETDTSTPQPESDHSP
ncbi:helix-turn-helix transcriptional regulator [Rhodococcus sp. HNM0563]|uniref:LuxR C-terminal-related transcriptional regulator n=1 Tax=Rhodococcus sp. HNM0563 TaxID=2716339 RepID=UPI00146A55FA|nr:helix-turn-helix transcriptional regulator [Rhodococcus sp. HNM0563]